MKRTYPRRLFKAERAQHAGVELGAPLTLHQRKPGATAVHPGGPCEAASFRLLTNIGQPAQPFGLAGRTLALRTVHHAEFAQDHAMRGNRMVPRPARDLVE